MPGDPRGAESIRQVRPLSKRHGASFDNSSASFEPVRAHNFLILCFNGSSYNLPELLLRHW
jgi:hypothetical protein